MAEIQTPRGAFRDPQIGAHVSSESPPLAPTMGQPPESATVAPLGERFQLLAKQWKENRGPGSSLTKIANDPAYLEIIQMGTPVIPYILAALAAEPDFWFAALRRITGENPITPEIQGDLHAMAAAWLQWGRANNVCKNHFAGSTCTASIAT